VSQPPQLPTSRRGSMQLPPHSSVPPWHAERHTPLSQRSPTPQVCPQAPQCSDLLWVTTQTPSQDSLPTGQDANCPGASSSQPAADRATIAPRRSTPILHLTNISATSTPVSWARCRFLRRRGNVVLTTTAVGAAVQPAIGDAVHLVAMLTADVHGLSPVAIRQNTVAEANGFEPIIMARKKRREAASPSELRNLRW